MQSTLAFAAESFDPSGFDPEAEFTRLNFLPPWQGEIPANPSHARVRWIQSSLNRLLGLRLTVDGIEGGQTRAAIRTFQQRNGLAVDGIAGPITMRAMVAAGADAPPSLDLPTDTIESAPPRLDDFDFDSSALKRPHLIEVERIARSIAASWQTPEPIMTVRVVGHTDPEGRPQHNQALGLRRALAVRSALQEALRNNRSDLPYKVLILASSKGESALLDTSNSPAGQARNRRVEVFLSTRALAPLPPPPPGPPTQPPFCDREKELSRMLADCERNFGNCMTKCKTDRAVIMRELRAVVGIAMCLRLKNRALIAACALARGGSTAKRLIDEYFRLDACEQSCKVMLKYCREIAANSSRRCAR